jgi:starch synthase
VDNHPLKIALISSEVYPLAKTGGLADAVGGLARSLAARGQRVIIFHPYYRAVKDHLRRINLKAEPTPVRLKIRIGSEEVEGGIRKVLLPGGITVYLVEQDGYFGGRDGVYQDEKGGYPDNPERFVFFEEAVLRGLRELGLRVDILHCHDWPTGFIPAYLHFRPAEAGYLSPPATVFTIHNLSFQGLFPFSRMTITNLPWGAYSPEGVEFFGQINPLKAGLVYSTLLTTVSRRYAREILSEEWGCGLEGVLRQRKKDLFAVTSGVDYREWNPATDRIIKSNFTPGNPGEKAACRKDLLERVNLPDGAPVVGMVSRITPQKGFELLLSALPDLLEKKLSLVILGKGYARLEEELKRRESEFPGKLRVRLEFSEDLAHRIIAGADFLLHPVRFEPGGLTPLYGLKYGTIPIVRATGGLDDNIRDYRPEEGTGNGFKFRDYSVSALLEKVERALAIYRRPARFRRLQSNAMSADFSWDEAAREYIKIYHKALEKRSG